MRKTKAELQVDLLNANLEIDRLKNRLKQLKEQMDAEIVLFSFLFMLIAATITYIMYSL